MPDPNRRGLGRGLEVLMGGAYAEAPELVHLRVDEIRPNPRQPRRQIDHETTAGLADSIRAQGVLQPVVVRPRAEGGYELIAGERRWRAAREAGLASVPALVRAADDRETLLLALVENVAREDLNAVEQARAYAVLSDELDLSQTEIARRVGKSRPAIANTLRLLDLPDPALDLIAAGKLSEGHGRAVLLAEGQDERAALARRAVERGWSVRDTEAAAKRAGRSAPKPARRAGAMDEELAHLAVDAAWQSLGLRAAVRQGPRGGRVEIHFATPAELGRIIDQLRAERVSWAD